MSFDRTTETIAHFVGHFDLILDELRLRAEYDEFKAEEKLEEERKALELSQAKVKTGHRLEEYDPKLKYAPDFASKAAVYDSAPMFQDFASPEMPFWQPWGPADSGAAVPGPKMALLLPYVPIPMSIATANLQMIHLFDADVVGPGNVDFTAPSVYYQHLVAASAFAEALSGPGSGMLDAYDALRFDEVDAFVAEMRAFEVPDIDGASATLLRDGDVIGIRINGEIVEEVADLNTLMPAALVAKYGLDEEEETTTDGEEQDEEVPDHYLNPVLDRDEEDVENPFSQDPGHHIHSGMNEATNSVQITTSTIDAGVIAVAGDVTNVVSVSQVNVVSDHDFGTSSQDIDTQAYNIAEIVFHDEDYAEDEDGNPIEPEEPAPVEMDHPAVWNLEVYEGDVMTLNAITQYTFALDSDRIEFTFSAGATMLGTGENIMFNAANFLEIGFGYDLIIVGGDMIDFTMVSQTNVLLDDDQVWTDGNVSISGADNMLVNHASIQQYGIDSYEDMSAHFATQLEQLELGSEDISNDIVEDDLFLGIGGLRVLYITGDLAQVTAVSQTNVIGDQDQVALALEEFTGDLDSVEIVTGSNALTNDVTISDLGFDSVVMAGGEVYDDALLYQAEFVDTDAAPTGVGLNDLASEAVAFLADDMLAPEYYEEDGQSGHVPSTSDEVDVMQTMTA